MAASPITSKNLQALLPMIIVGIVLILTVIAFIRGDESVFVPGPDSAKLRGLLPEALPRCEDGNRVPTDEALRHRHVVVYVTSSTCVPCKDFTPQLQRFAREHIDTHDLGFLVWPIENDAATHLEYARSIGAPFLYVPFGTPQMAAFESYGVRGTPTLLVFDAQGKLSLSSSGATPEKVLEQLRQRLLTDEG